MPNSTSSLDRNDVDGALERYRKAVLAGQWHPHLAESLLMLQDDWRSLSKAMTKLERTDEKFAAMLKAQQEHFASLRQ